MLVVIVMEKICVLVNVSNASESKSALILLYGCRFGRGMLK